MSMDQLMLDIETMGKGPNAAIVAIGAAMFDPAALSLGATFYARINLDAAVRTGGIMDASTVLWWMRQDDAARAELVAELGDHMSAALMSLRAFIAPFAEVSAVRVWGNGATFDNVILGTAFERTGITKPWGYRHDRCFRTLRELCPVAPVEFDGTPHHALHDAVHQAKHALAIAKAYPNLNWS